MLYYFKVQVPTLESTSQSDLLHFKPKDILALNLTKEVNFLVTYFTNYDTAQMPVLCPPLYIYSIIYIRYWQMAATRSTSDKRLNLLTNWYVNTGITV